MKEVKTVRVEFTVESRSGMTKRVSLEGKNVDKLLKKVEKRDGYNVLVMAEI